MTRYSLHVWFVVVCAGLCLLTENETAANGLKSAYLGGSVWEENLSSSEINDRLKEHFAEVLVQLEAKNASGLLTALRRAEASSLNRWSKSERRAALIYLAQNRQRQIERIRDYMNRGRFPLNEGQSPDAVPVFVDRHDTHCAVAHLMRSDGRTSDVAKIVNTDNLVRVRIDIGGSMGQWIRTSGLTHEEVAMIQPAYPIDGLTTFQSFHGTSNVLESNGYSLSNATIRGARFSATLPDSFVTNPSAIDAIFELGKVELENNNVVGDFFRGTKGLLFGEGNAGVADYGYRLAPSNLDDWLYFGGDDWIWGGLIGGANASGNVGIIEVEYQIRSEEGRNFSKVALTSTAGENQNSLDNSDEQNALLILSEIYRGDSNVLLAQQELFTAARVQSSQFTPLIDSATRSLDEDYLRIKTYGLVAGDGSINRIFNEFETLAIPEPSSAIAGLLIVVFVAGRRKRASLR